MKKLYSYELASIIRLYKKYGSLEDVSRKMKIPYGFIWRDLKKHGIEIRVLKRDIPLPSLLPRKHHKYHVGIKKVVRLFKRYGFLPKVSAITGIPTSHLREILIEKFGMGLRELRGKLSPSKAYLKRRAMTKNSTRYQQVKELYDRLRTLAKVGEELNLTRERVRQILKYGDRLGIFDYEKTRKGRIKELTQKYSREDIINSIKTIVDRTEICSKLDISTGEYDSLSNHYGIDRAEYTRSARMGKYLERYSKIVETLGYHPSTTEMNSRKEWRAICAAISRYWGTMENFRKEFGIEKPRHKLSPNFITFLEKRKSKVEVNKNNIIDLLRTKGALSLKELSVDLGISSASLYNTYILELKRNGIIEVVGKRRKAKYKMLNNDLTLPYLVDKSLR